MTLKKLENDIEELRSMINKLYFNIKYRDIKYRELIECKKELSKLNERS